MIVIRGRNVNTNYSQSIAAICELGASDSSRAGEVIVAPSPVMTVTENPTERVLFDPRRDANPFFHFFECLWMLSGSADGRFLDRFVSDFSARFGEDDGKIWGSYGHRWIHHFTKNQVSTCVNLLRKNPRDRRVVIAMWDPRSDLGAQTKDVPCNTHIYPRIVTRYGRDGLSETVLDITVCCRSNDIIWGATGANAVHFSFLQEVMASMIGVGVGTMYQLSNNWHAYTSVLEKVGEPTLGTDLYDLGTVEPFPVVDDQSTWHRELRKFLETDGVEGMTYSNRFFPMVAVPMLRAHDAFKRRDNHMTMANLARVAAEDWRVAAEAWVSRRI